MEFTTQIRKLSLWIFIIPFVAVNLCLFVSTNYHIFDNTFLTVIKLEDRTQHFPISMVEFQLAEQQEHILPI